jgi:hypothetical protein
LTIGVLFRILVLRRKKIAQPQKLRSKAMDMKKIEGFKTTRDAAMTAKAIEFRVDGGQQFQTLAPVIRQAPAASHGANA